MTARWRSIRRIFVATALRRVCRIPQERNKEQTLITDPSYISEHMFDKVVREKFQDNADDKAVQDQARKMLAILRNGRTHGRIIADVIHASKVARRTSTQDIAEIGFLMGLQFGFELALSFPPIPAAE